MKRRYPITSCDLISIYNGPAKFEVAISNGLHKKCDIWTDTRSQTWQIDFDTKSIYSKTYVKRPDKNRQNKDFNNNW